METVPMGDLRINAPDRKIHLGKPPRRVVRLLTTDRHAVARLAAIAVAVGMRRNEIGRLNEHAARSAAWVKDTALIRRQHFDQNSHDAARRVELSALLAFGAGELLSLIHISEPTRQAEISYA